MKLLLFSDLHADTAAAARLVSLSVNVDVIVGAGDFGNMRRQVSTCIDILRDIHKPAVLVPGNNETCEQLTDACGPWPTATVLHGRAKEVDGVTFFGIGGGIPVTPFGEWSYDFSEADAERLLAGCPQSAVLISHSPPKGAIDISSSGRSLGSVSVRNAITRTKPRLVVCGHIHGSGGQNALIESTPVVNAGPIGIVWEI